MARVRQEAAVARSHAERLEDEASRRPPNPVAIGQGIGVCERVLDASQTLTQWCSTITSERSFVGLVCYTFDHEVVRRALISSKRWRAQVCIIADAGKTNEKPDNGQMFARLQNEGIEVRVGRGYPLRNVHPDAQPGGTLGDRLGAHHAKVLFASSRQVLFVGSTNFTQSSQANVETCAQIALRPEGVIQISSWFNELWHNAIPHVMGSGPADARSPSRRARSQSARQASRPSRSGPSGGP